MPLDRNLSGLPNIQSVRVWLYPEYTAYSQSGPMPGGEVAAAVATFVVYEGFAGRNQTGASIGRGCIDTTPQSALAYFNATSVDALLLQVFGSGP